MSALAVNTHTPVDASGGAVTMTLPTGQAQGTVISVEKYDTSANTVTVSGSIRGTSTTLTLTTAHQTVVFLADSAGSWWPTAGHILKSVLDGLYATKPTGTPDGTKFYRDDGTFVTPPGGGILHREKTADTSLTGFGSAPNDADLQATVAANTRYRCRAIVFLSAAVADDITVALVTPTGSFFAVKAEGWAATATASPVTKSVRTLASSGNNSLSVGTIDTTAGNQTWVELEGTITIGSTAGTVALGIGLRTSDSGGALVRRGSVLDLIPT